MSPAVLEAQRGREPGDTDQSRLFDDLRRPTPARATPECEPEFDASAVEVAGARGERHPRSGNDRLTLEAHLERIWEGLLAAGGAECPLCGASLEWSGEAGACRGCGCTLA